jgi:hypothetical protein
MLRGMKWIRMFGSPLEGIFVVFSHRVERITMLGSRVEGITMLGSRVERVTTMFEGF